MPVFPRDGKLLVAATSKGRCTAPRTSEHQQRVKEEVWDSQNRLVGRYQTDPTQETFHCARMRLNH
jgi:hypothetical protein